jgi:hypothetical protein
MFFLRYPPGKYSVGATNFVFPAETPHVVGGATLPSTNGPKPLLKLEEIAFTAYYPARVEGNPKYGMEWIVRYAYPQDVAADSTHFNLLLHRPLKHAVRGYASFSRISTAFVRPFIYLFGSFIKVNYYPPKQSRSMIICPRFQSSPMRPFWIRRFRGRSRVRLLAVGRWSFSRMAWAEGRGLTGSYSK